MRNLLYYFGAGYIFLLCTVAWGASSNFARNKPAANQPHTAPKSSPPRPVAFNLGKGAVEPEVPAVRYLLAGCGPKFNALSYNYNSRTTFDTNIATAITAFQMSRKLPVDGTAEFHTVYLRAIHSFLIFSFSLPYSGAFGPATLEKAILCQPINKPRAVGTRLWSVWALQTLLRKSKEFRVRSNGMFDEKTQAALKVRSVRTPFPFPVVDLFLRNLTLPFWAETT